MSFLRVKNILVNSQYVISILRETNDDPWRVRLHSSVGLGMDPIEVDTKEILRFLKFFGILANETTLTSFSSFYS